LAAVNATSFNTTALLGIAASTATGSISNLRNPMMPAAPDLPCSSQVSCSPKPAGLCPPNADQNCVPKVPSQPKPGPQKQSSLQQSASQHTTAPLSYQAPTKSSSGSGAVKSSGSAGFYTVGSGDTLWSIAARFYGSGSLWPTLYQKNRGVIGSNPNLIFSKERLVL
jgi:LysM repeat protein